MKPEQKVIEEHLKEFQICSYRSEKIYRAMQDIWFVCCSRDDKNLEKMKMSDLGLSLLKLAQFYGEAGEMNRSEFFDPTSSSASFLNLN